MFQLTGTYGKVSRFRPDPPFRPLKLIAVSEFLVSFRFRTNPEFQYTAFIIFGHPTVCAIVNFGHRLFAQS